MPCLCGDTACPSCGPAQGFDPRLEAFWDKAFEKWPELQDAVEGPLMSYLEDAFGFAIEFGYIVGRADGAEDSYIRQQVEEYEKIHEARIEKQLDDLVDNDVDAWKEGKLK